MLFVFITVYMNTRNQTHRSCCVLFILPSVAGPYKSLYKNVPSCDLYRESWKDVFVLGTTTICIVEPTSPLKKKKKISYQHECMREAPELLTLFWLECMTFGECNVYFSAIKLLSYTNHNCNCMIAVCSSSKVVAGKSVICHPLLKIAQLFHFAVFTSL